MVILSEVVAPRKREYRGKKTSKRIPIVCSTLIAFLLTTISQAADPKVSLTSLNDCNWMVTYRGRTYDLAPLTREALARPIESDIRYALQRVPKANAHLESMSENLRAARAHTIIASILISGFAVTRILRATQKNERERREYDVYSGATGAFFLAATAFSWKSTREAKRELVNAVAAFNDESSQKIEPASAGQALVTP